MQIPTDSGHRHRELAAGASLAMFFYLLVFGLGELSLAGVGHADVLWEPALIPISWGLNLAGAGLALTYYMGVRLLPKVSNNPERVYAHMTCITLIGTQLFCLAHMHLGGSHSTMVISSLLIQVVLIAWFAPWRAVLPLLAMCVLSTIALFVLEYQRVLVYAPMLRRRAVLEPIYLDWRWVAGDTWMFVSFVGAVAYSVWQIRKRFELREDQLELRVRARTRDLERQIEQTRAASEALAAEAQQRELAEASERRLRDELERARNAATIGELAGGIAHELNQPLGGILANTQAAQRLLAADPPNIDEARAALDDIYDDEQRAEAVIAAVRSLAKADTSAHEPVQLAQPIDEALRMLRHVAADAGVEVVVTQSDPSLALVGSRVQLPQLVLNLVRNAIDACDRGGVVHVTCDADDEQLRLVVSDSGPGFSPTVLSHAFEPWVTTRSSGMGLGLALCRRIVEQHGGTIAADNTETGARVSVRLPRFG
jgi:C4-dicarboxylate-specific signal transduction histidine kinase